MFMDIEEIRFREVQMFLDLIQLKSVRELARQRNMQPGQVSKWIQGLEKKCGFALLERSAQGITPTQKALELLPLFKEIEELQERMRGTNSVQTKSLDITIASSSYFSTHLLPSLMEEIFNSKKNYQVKILDLAPTQFVSAGLRGAFEYCLHSQELEWPKTWTTVEVGQIPAYIYARKKNPILKNPTLKEVVKCPFVMPIYWTPEGSRLGDDQCPIPMKNRIRGHETGTAASALEIIKLTDQVSFLPEIIARENVRQGNIVALQHPTLKTSFQPVYLSVKSSTVLKKDFDWIASIFKAKLS
jgi:DNA-binding transcriptional LysR family regulator